MSKLDPRQTLITLPDEIRWQVPEVAPPESVAEAVLAGAEWQERSIGCHAACIAPDTLSDQEQLTYRLWPVQRVPSSRAGCNYCVNHAAR